MERPLGADRAGGAGVPRGYDIQIPDLADDAPKFLFPKTAIFHAKLFRLGF